MKILQDIRQLESSSIVANSLMNRERGLRGGNSYEKELGFNPLDLLKERLRGESSANWLDLCCGSGKALVEAAREIKALGLEERIRLVGIDLVPMFFPIPDGCRFLELKAESVAARKSNEAFDLVTCIHGVHYLGDKLGMIRQAAEQLKIGGTFIGHLDPTNLKFEDGNPAGRAVLKCLKTIGFAFHPRKRLLSIRKTRTDISFEILSRFKYLGADDQAGPNFSGQPAVDSYYSNRINPF